jgi:hypothetical protein
MPIYTAATAAALFALALTILLVVALRVHGRARRRLELEGSEGLSPERRARIEQFVKR